MRRPLNLVLGVLTLLPIPLLVGGVPAISAFAPANYEPPPVLGFGVVLFWATITFGPLILLVIDAMRNERLTEAQRTQWIIILVCLAIFTMPIYFWRHRWPRVNSGAAYAR